MNIPTIPGSIYDISLPGRIKVIIKRDDQIHPEISGNKWYKIKYNMMEAKKSGLHRILTFGGAYSNHIFAAAAAGREEGMEMIGVIRGEEHLPLNPTLQFASGNKMRLHYISRSVYRKKEDPGFIRYLESFYGPFYLLPEGGTNRYAIKGCMEILKGIDLSSFDILCLACGTGGTLAGILESLNGKKFCIGFPVLKNGSFLRKKIDQLNLEFSGNRYQNYILNTRYHLGGYARFNQPLVQFINDFRHQYGIPLDPVYTGKMMYGVFDLINSGAFREGTRILIIHTGGLQGISGFNERHGNLIR